MKLKRDATHCQQRACMCHDDGGVIPYGYCTWCGCRPLSDEQQRKDRATKDQKNAARRARHQAYTDLGMVRVRGSQGGTYYE